MHRSRQIAYGLVACVAVGCASQQPSTPPTPQPEGPKAFVHASYQGGIVNRQTEAVFKVDEPAYVMVAHLGGDGRITVLYPEDSRESGRVQAGKWFRTDMVAAYYDAAPQLYSFTTTTFRNYGAQLDSYDGRGYGYIFLVEMVFLAKQQGLHIAEVPIHFNDRRLGQSKMSLKIQLEAAGRIWQVRFAHRDK